MTPFQRFIRLYDPKSVVLVGCTLALAGLAVTIGGYHIGSTAVAMGGFIALVAMVVGTLMCGIFAMIRRGDNTTPGNGIILKPGLGPIREDELIPFTDETFMRDLAKNIPTFKT